MGRVIGWLADSDFWCERCLPYEKEGVDSEGNRVDPIFWDEEFDYPVHCCKCDTFLRNKLTGDGEIYVIDLVREDIEKYGAPDDITAEYVERYDYLFCSDCEAQGCPECNGSGLSAYGRELTGEIVARNS